jgi:hypothetical protein
VPFWCWVATCETWLGRHELDAEPILVAVNRHGRGKRSVSGGLNDCFSRSVVRPHRPDQECFQLASSENGVTVIAKVDKSRVTGIQRNLMSVAGA